MKILLIDDQAFQRKIYNMVLSSANYEVIEAENGKEGIEILNNDPDIKCVLLDAIMPEMDGFETCRALRSGSDIPVIFLTGNSDQETIDTAMDSGVSDYFVKCSTPHDILPKIEALI